MIDNTQYEYCDKGKVETANYREKEEILQGPFVGSSLYSV